MTHKPEQWPEFYRGRLLDQGYLDYCEGRYEIFLRQIRSRMTYGDRLVEVGCGLATMTKLLSSRKEQFCGFRGYDINPDIVALAKINLQPQEYPINVGDARTQTGSKPDIVHSHGMLEHLSDEDINLVIQASELDGARWAIHYVPGAKYKTPSYGDERLLTVEQWGRICRPNEIVTFNDGYDYCLIWRF